MNANTTKTIIGSLLPFASNPLVLAAIGAGAAAWLVSSLFDDDEDKENNGSNGQKNRSEPQKQPLKRTVQTVKPTVRQPLPQTSTTVEEIVQKQLNEAASELSNVEESEPNDPILDAPGGDQKSAPMHDEAEKKEIIRKAMSELGKRSAASRSRKKS